VEGDVQRVPVFGQEADAVEAEQFGFDGAAHASQKFLAVTVEDDVVVGPGVGDLLADPMKTPVEVRLGLSGEDAPGELSIEGGMMKMPMTFRREIDRSR